MIRISIFYVAAFGLLSFCAGAQGDYKKIFGSDYDEAIAFLEKEKWIAERINKFGLPAEEVLSIVFPELIRYHSIQDKIEVFALESLYIKYGKSYANFSIGRFQLKPSFIEILEKELLKTPTLSNFATARDTTQNEANRNRRLQRMKKLQFAVDYVCLFYKWIQLNYPDFESTEKKIKFYAAAYNCGFTLAKSEIEKFVSKKFFHVGMVSGTKYSYADIAWYYYNRNAKK